MAFYCLKERTGQRPGPKWLAGSNEHAPLVNPYPLSDPPLLDHDCQLTKPPRVLFRKQQVTPMVWLGPWICVLRDDVLAQLRGMKVTGFEAEPIDVRVGFPCTDIPKYWRMIVTGWGGIVPEQLGVHRSPARQPASPTYTIEPHSRIQVDASQWDGSDVFLIWPFPRYLFVTERVARLLEAQCARQCELIPLDELELPTSVTPGRLRCYLSDARARELGEAGDIY